MLSSSRQSGASVGQQAAYGGGVDNGTAAGQRKNASVKMPGMSMADFTDRNARYGRNDGWCADRRAGCETGREQPYGKSNL